MELDLSDHWSNPDDDVPLPNISRHVDAENVELKMCATATVMISEKSSECQVSFRWFGYDHLGECMYGEVKLEDYADELHILKFSPLSNIITTVRVFNNNEFRVIGFDNYMATIMIVPYDQTRRTLLLYNAMNNEAVEYLFVGEHMEFYEDMCGNIINTVYCMEPASWIMFLCRNTRDRLFIRLHFNDVTKNFYFSEGQQLPDIVKGSFKMKVVDKSSVLLYNLRSAYIYRINVNTNSCTKLISEIPYEVLRVLYYCNCQVLGSSVERGIDIQGAYMYNLLTNDCTAMNISLTENAIVPMVCRFRNWSFHPLDAHCYYVENPKTELLSAIFTKITRIHRIDSIEMHCYRYYFDVVMFVQSRDLDLKKMCVRTILKNVSEEFKHKGRKEVINQLGLPHSLSVEFI